MDKLFKKRTNSSGEAAHTRPATLKKATSNHALSEKAAGKQRSPSGAGQEYRMAEKATRKVADVAPSLNVDIRNSLILPGLSQRFSVLLPSLSTIPETSIRDLLASQRARHDGPSITEEEEELLFAEMRSSNTSPPQSHPGLPFRSPSATSPSAWSARSDETSFLSSTSSPSFTSDGSSPPTSAPLTHTTFWGNSSPPPTSTSFSSFQTFGVNDVRTKSYGFSGGSGMRDGEYIRRVKKTASGRNLSGSTGAGTPTKENAPWTMPLPPISPDQANSYFKKRSDSPSGSEGTATPTSALQPMTSNITRPSRGQSPSSTSSLNLPLPPQPPVPKSLPPPTPNSPDNRPGKKRQSLLAGLSAAQVKRISLALGELEGMLSRAAKTRSQERMNGFNEDEEEVLDAIPKEDSPGHVRRPSNARSEHSDASSVFPYTISPTQNTFTSISTMEPPSPSRLPPSPRSRNLAAHVETSMPLPPQLILIRNPSDIPRPILTPSKTRPVRHTPNKSSISSISPAIPMYIPGQPRPVGSMHRSENSITFSSSSRSATPTFTPTSPSIDMLNRARAESPFTSGPSIPNRSVSLARSTSTRTNASSSPSINSHSGPSSRDHANLSPNTSPNPNLLSPRLNESTFRRSPTPNASTIEEADESNSDLEEGDTSRDSEPPMIKPVLGWRQVSEAGNMHKANQEPLAVGILNGMTSHQGSLHDTYESHQVVKRASKNSLDSVYQGLADDTGFAALGFESPEDEGLSTPVEEEERDWGSVLIGTIGVGPAELRQIQRWLVDKAKKEREAFRAGVEESPYVQESPNIPASVFPVKNVPALGPTSPPPSAWRAPTPVQDTSITKRRSEDNVGVKSPPPDLGAVLPSAEPLEGHVNPTREAIVNAPRRAPPAPPSAHSPGEVITTPATAPIVTRNNSINATDMLSRNNSISVADMLSRKNSTRGDKEDDEEKRRDFEARIAAATAALNRTPSISAAGRLERKGTKTKGPMVISSPTLVSSSIKLPSSPMTPPDGVDPAVAKAMEKASGSSSKMSWRWKKFKSRKGLSFSGDDGSPVTPMPPMPKRDEHKLEGPIALRKEEVLPVKNDGVGVGNNNSPDLNAFKFPPASASAVGSFGMGQNVPTPPGSANPTSGLKQSMRKDSHQKAEDPAVNSPVDTPTPNLSTHSPASSFDEAAMAKFIEAGRGLGLKDEQLNEMLAQKGVLNRSTTSVSTRSYQSTAPTTNSFSHPSPSVASPIPTPAMSEKGQKSVGGLFRSLSKGRKVKQDDTVKPEVEPVPSRNVVVRRTLLIPTIEAIPSTPQLNPASPLLSSESPDRFVGGRKMSVKRKPLNLTPQDRELVSSSPKRDRFGSVDEHGGLLKPSPAGSALGRSDGSVGSRSSGGAGSFYDLYGDGPEEVLGSPEKVGNVETGVRASKAVEIAEYADGQVVWSLVGALRDGLPEAVEHMEGEEAEAGEGNHSHSRSTSYASSRRESEGGSDVFTAPGRLGKPTQALMFRHRDRSVAEGPRPETNVYFTSDADVADLIDHLSHDLNASKGRIDIHPTSTSPLPYPQNLTAASSPFPYTSSSSPNPAFEDAPSASSTSSPRKPPPGPIHTVPAGGFSPKRQMFIRQGFGAHRGLGSVGSTSGNGVSPSQASFDSEMSSGKTVEERLQALLDRLKESGAGVQV